MLRLSVETPDLGEAQDELEVEYNGEPLEIGFNANYLLELLRYMPTDEVKLTFKAPERAATIEPLGNEDVARIKDWMRKSRDRMGRRGASAHHRA